MTKIAIEIKDCTECPYHKVKREYTGDSWELVLRYNCGKKNGKYIGTTDLGDPNPEVPNWCPIKVE